MPAATADPQAELAKIIAAAEKKLGKGAIHKGSETEQVHHLPFRSPNMNYATEGGAPFGRFMAAYGDESVGKTRQAYELIAQLQQLPESAEITLLPRIAYHQMRAQNTGFSDDHRRRHEKQANKLESELEWIRATFPDGGDAVYYNAEQQYDPLYAKRIGIDTNRLTIVESTTIEEICEVMQGLYAHIPMHVVDSTSSASSVLQQKQEVGKSLIGTDARQWKNSLRDTMPFFDPSRNIALLIHQMSTNIRTGGAQASSTRYLRHTSSCSIKFSRGKFLWRKDGILVEDKPTGADEQSMAGIAETDGVEVFAKIEKSRTCRPMRVGSLQFDYQRLRFVTESELASAALYFGLARQAGSHFYAIDANGEEQRVGQGLKVLQGAISDDADYQSRIMTRLLDYTGEV